MNFKNLTKKYKNVFSIDWENERTAYGIRYNRKTINNVPISILARLVANGFVDVFILDPVIFQKVTKHEKKIIERWHQIRRQRRLEK